MPTDPAQVSSSQTTLLVIACVLIVGCIGGMVLAAVKPAKPRQPTPFSGAPHTSTELPQLSEQAARAIIAMERRQRFSFGRVLALLLFSGVLLVLIAMCAGMVLNAR